MHSVIANRKTGTETFNVPPVVVQGLRKAYNSGPVSTQVLDGIDFRAESHECVFLTGPSGSGKTTLLSVLGCVLTPDHGSVRILGQEVSHMTGTERALLRRDRIGFVFQKFHLLRGLTAMENVSIPLTLSGIKRSSANNRARDLLERVGLGTKADSLPSKLSIGQCQRVALARALVADPELILADEPTASLDAQNGQEVMKLLKRAVVEDGRTAIIVTHDHRILEFADRVLHLENGRIAREESVKS